MNGAMTVAQRGTSAVTATANFPVDRFRVDHSTDGAFTAQQSTDVPSGQGFVNSIKYQTTTADSSLAADQFFYTRQIIEGLNSARLMFGSSSAKTLTLSFWVKSSLTGTFGGSVWNEAFNRSYPYSYTIDAADTWEKKTITFTGDTTGTWLTTNGRGINVGWGLGIGSDYLGTAGAWAASGLISPTGATSVIGTLNATWYITGVQLEVGDTATDFEHRTYGDELIKCKRYFTQWTGTANQTVGTGTVITGTTSFVDVQFPIEMRTGPTITQSSTYIYEPAASTVSSLGTIYNDESSAGVNITHSSGLTTGRAAMWNLTATGSYVRADAEL
tara:strand:+ start:19 stop:1008 length:990 start_codon:yes stop_codon:yes gene_type:complete